VIDFRVSDYGSVWRVEATDWRRTNANSPFPTTVADRTDAGRLQGAGRKRSSPRVKCGLAIRPRGPGLRFHNPAL